MPPAIGVALLTAAGVADTTLVAGVSLSSVLGYGLVGLGVVGLSLLTKAPDQDTSQQIIVKQALPTRTRIFGRAKVGGALAFLETSNGTLFQAIIHCGGPVDSFGAWYLNDADTGITPGAGGGVNQAEPWENIITIESHLGGPAQPSSPTLTGTFPQWTSAHQLKGLAYSVVSHALPQDPRKNFQKYFPNGAPALRVVISGDQVYDPRTGAMAWSQNAALCIRDFLTHPRGYRIPASRINDASFSAFASLCDQPVALKEGGTVARWVIGGVWDLTDKPTDTLRGMLDGCDAELVTLPDGTLGIQGGQWTEPTVTIDDSLIVGYQYQAEQDALAAYNQLKIKYTETDADYQVIEGTAWDDLDSQNEVGVIVQELSVPDVQSHSQARRLAKIKMAKDNPRHQFTLTTSFGGMIAFGERTIRVKLAELSIDESFLITKFGIADDLSTCTIGVASLDGSVYTWDASTEEGDSPVYAFSEPVTVAAPDPVSTSTTLVRTNITSGGAAMQARATAAQPDPADPNTPGYSLIGRYRQVGTTSWTPMKPATQYVVISDYLTDGLSYEVQVAYEGYGTLSDWVGAGTVQALSDPNAPTSPTGFTAAKSGSSANLAWTNPGNSNFAFTRVFRGTSSSFGSATALGDVAGNPGSAGTFADTPGSGTFYYFVAAANHSASLSSATGPASVTF